MSDKNVGPEEGKERDGEKKSRKPKRRLVGMPCGRSHRRSLSMYV